MLLESIRPAAAKPKSPKPPPAADDSSGGEPKLAPKPTSVSPVETKPSPPSPVVAVAAQAIPSATEIPPAPALTKPVEIPKPTELEAKPKVINEAKSDSKDSGRGGARHKSIQERLKAEAHKLGFRAEVEKQIAAGSNAAADLVLRLGHIEIAVEITVTTSVDHEFENVKKCLDAGFARVAMIATGRKRLNEIADAVKAGLGSAALAKVSFHTPDEFLLELQNLAKTATAAPPSLPMAKHDKKLGFEIERFFNKLKPTEQQANDRAINEVVLKTLKS
jgi:hypothetical protein